MTNFNFNNKHSVLKTQTYFETLEIFLQMSIQKGAILGLGNPLLDITAEVPINCKAKIER